MSGELKTAVDRVSSEKDKIKQSFEDIKTALTEKSVTVPQEIHLSGVPDLIRTITGGGSSLKIEVTADDYEGATFTATHSDQETKATGTISEKKTTINVPKAGTYTVSNDVDEQTQEAELIDLVNLSFIKFQATIKVTLDESLIGETITCSLESENLEQKAETTTVTFTVKKKGNWKIGIKGNTYVTATVDVQNNQEYTSKLTVDPAKVPTLTVRSKEEDNGKTIKCTKSETVLEKVLKNRQCTFILPETGTWKVTCDDYPEITKNVNVAEAKAYRCALRSSVLGAKITETESEPAERVDYTDDAVDLQPVKINLQDGSVDYGEWKELWPFEKIYPAMVKTDGSIAYKLNPDDQTKKAEGGASEINSTSFDGNAMVVVEKFYTKFGMDGENETIQISDEEEDGFEAIGFIRQDGSEADYICLPMFMGSFDESSKLRSLSEQDIKYSTSFTDFRTAAQKNGSGYDIEIYAMNQILTALYLILFKTCNWREALGEGRTYDNATNKKTGVLANKGGIAFDPTTKATKFLWIEDYVSWPQSGTPIYRWEAGILCKNKENYVRMKPPYSGTDTSTYEKVTDHVFGQGYIKKMKADNKYGRTSIDATGSDKSYECCQWYDNNNTSGTVYISLRGNDYGVAGRFINNNASNSNGDIGAALSLVPPA